MNKNPFVPQPSYPHPPPLPPGPPPQGGQPDYSAYWAAAAAVQQQQQQQHPAPAPPYNPQWTAPQPARPAEQNALYANYGYGSQHNSQWHRVQHQQPYQQPPPPAVQPPPPPPAAQPAYNPYQPAAAYPQPYIPQQMSQQPPPQSSYQPQLVPQQSFIPRPGIPPHPHPQSLPPQQPPHHQQQQHQQHHAHHSQQQHPAKRQRFDGPSHNQPFRQQSSSQSQFHPPPPSQGPSFNAGRGGIPSGPSHNRGGGGGGGGGSGPSRGGPSSGRGGRGASLSSNRGGSNNRGGRGGSQMSGGGRGAGSVRGGHGSRSNFGNRDHQNRKGGSFSNANTGGSYSHQSQSNYRGRGQSHNRTGRNDHSSSSRDGGGSSAAFGNFASGKKDENRRTLTDFKLVGLEIRELDWTWGLIPSPFKQEDVAHDDHLAGVDADADANGLDDVISQSTVKAEDASEDTSSSQPTSSQGTTHKYAAGGPKENASPSRIRIYFHTPVSTDDSHPIPHSTYSGDFAADTRKGKRKKIEDDDADIEEGRAPPPPPQMAFGNEDRSVSVAPSIAVTEPVSEADWLMAAIAEGDESRPAHDDEDQLHVTQVIDTDEDAYEAATQPAYDEDEGNLIAHDLDMPYGDPDENGGNHSSTSGDELLKETVLPPRLANGVVDHETHHTNGHQEGSAPENADSAVSVADSPSSPHHTDYAADHSSHSDEQEKKPNGMPQDTPTVLSLDASPTLVEEDSSATSGVTVVSDESIPKEDHVEQQEHLPEPPASPFVSTSSASNHDDSGAQSGPAKAPLTPSANRLSISYASGTRRLVIDAEVVQSLKVSRKEGRIDVSMIVSKLENENGETGLKGFLIEKLSDVTKSYHSLHTLSDTSETDPTLPPFSKLTTPCPLTLLVYLDTEKPLSEPKWVKSGDVQDWLKTMFGRMFWVAGDAADGWEKKIEVADPDPPPTIWTVLESWAVNSPVGQPNERQRFLKTHLTETDNILEILLRLVRGERATPFSQSSNPAISAPNVSGPLLNALTPGFAHSGQQTHVSLAVLATFRMAVEYAKKMDGDHGKTEVEERMGEIIRSLPTHLLYKSLDGMFKEWKVEKKGR